MTEIIQDGHIIDPKEDSSKAFVRHALISHHRTRMIEVGGIGVCIGIPANMKSDTLSLSFSLFLLWLCVQYIRLWYDAGILLMTQ